MGSPVDDGALLEAWRSGDNAAGRALVARHFDSVFQFFVNKAPAQAEDLVQETFVAVVEARDRLRDDAAFRPYLFGTARRLLYRFWRARRGDKAEEASVEELSDDGATPSYALARHQEQKLLLKALRRLPLNTQVLVELSYFQNLTDRELAELEGIALGTLKSRLRKARHDLDIMMGEIGGAELLASTTHDFDRWVLELRSILRPRTAEK